MFQHAWILAMVTSGMIVRVYSACNQETEAGWDRGYQFNWVKMNCTNITLWDLNYDRNVRYTTITISLSNITVLPHSAFPHIVNISELYMENVNMISVLPGAFIGHSHVNKINFAGNNLSSVPEGVFNSFVNLTVLDLSRNAIENISDHAFVGAKLTYLNLSRNAISSLGSVLKYLPDLEQVDLSFNNLSFIENCFENKELDLLKVDHNKIRTLDMKYLPPVKIFDISSNILSELVVPNNDTFIEIYLRNNKLSSIEPSSRNVEVLDVGDNLLQNVSKSLFRKSVGLRKLYLDGNGLSNIPSSIFHGLANLTVLDLSNNNLSSFVSGTFDSLKQLQTLNVSNNRLEKVPVAFHSLGGLQNLYLHNNELNDLNLNGLFDGMFNLRTVNLDGNKWSCQDLRNITIQLRKKWVEIISGAYSEGTHVFDMSCEESDSENADKLNRFNHGQRLEVNIDGSKLQKFFNDDFENSVLYRFFGSDFKNTTFARYLDNLPLHKPETPENNSDSNLATEVRRLENSTKVLLDQLSKSLKTTDQSLKNTTNLSLEQFSSNLKTIAEETFKEIAKSFSDKQLSSDRNLTTSLDDLTLSMKSLENYVKKLSQSLDMTLKLQGRISSQRFSETVQEKFVTERSNSNNEYKTVAIFIMIIMIVIAVMISAIFYILAFKFRYNSLRNDIQLSPIIDNTC